MVESVLKTNSFLASFRKNISADNPNGPADVPVWCPTKESTAPVPPDAPAKTVNKSLFKIVPRQKSESRPGCRA